MSYLPTKYLLETVFHLWFRKSRWNENMLMVDNVTYPTLSISPVMRSVERVLILGYKILSLKWQDEYYISKDLSSNVANHAGPSISIYDELEVIIIWHLIPHMAHLIMKQMSCCSGHTLSHAPFRTCSAKCVGVFLLQGHIHLMCLSSNHAPKKISSNINQGNHKENHVGCHV